jgi:ribosomal protein L7Ae-like RNA K-turn-binding protein
MMKNKMLSYLGLAMRAGKLVTGDEGVLKAVRQGQANLVVLAEDASANAQKKYRDKCQSYQIPLIECCTRYELGSSIGKAERVVIAVTDSGLAQMIERCLEKPAEVENIE